MTEDGVKTIEKIADYIDKKSPRINLNDKLTNPDIMWKSYIISTFKENLDFIKYGLGIKRPRRFVGITKCMNLMHKHYKKCDQYYGKIFRKRYRGVTILETKNMFFDRL